MDLLVDELLKEFAEEDRLQTALTKDDSMGYLYAESEKYKEILDSHQEIRGPNIFESLGNSVLLLKNSDSIDYAEISVVKSDVVLLEQDDWSELKAPKVELKSLPAGLKYAFLGPNSTYLIIVNAALSEQELNLLITELKRFRKAIDYSLDDIKDISPNFFY